MVLDCKDDKVERTPVGCDGEVRLANIGWNDEFWEAPVDRTIEIVLIGLTHVDEVVLIGVTHVDEVVLSGVALGIQSVLVGVALVVLAILVGMALVA
ncbi:hypothetical protein Pcinc_005617 [Petrolisthes cinctipes]|uniref:Uncharacterized protein n=1 Tax=Petrolisthes cinctipes TaxID=88211 RepID=A0AAE1GET5_PETCI|nr:hypothetical protein Pcinc_018394 [Petrolisthes cinctipes]KAK3890432.1 hypothetical protein Pcinc_005617 [Petrolisthes cinctipes]